MHIPINCRNLFKFSLIISLLPKYIVANVWSWILNEPIQHSESVMSLSNNHTDMADKPHVRAPAPSPIGTASERFTAHITSPCSDKKSCGRGRFCDEYYGRCERLRRRSDFCRKDHHCHRKHECVFGRCRKEIPKGQEGSRCASDGDCPSNHCCARQHGEYICKPKLRQSMKCFVPAGGLDYSLNEQCPCENGLICRYEPLKPSTASPVNKISPKNEWFQFSSDTEHMRCLPVSSGSTTHNEDYYDVQESDKQRQEEQQ